MDQSNIIALSILFAFVLFVTLRGELGIYIGFLVG